MELPFVLKYAQLVVFCGLLMSDKWRTEKYYHAIYYKIINEDEVLVLNVLHRRMGQLKHL